jgi:glycosyltransferase involved in cell wall biosynthesis
MERKKILFLMWKCPWPPRGGGDLRTLGLLKELAKGYKLDAIMLFKESLDIEQKKYLQEYIENLICVPLFNLKSLKIIRLIFIILFEQLPFHCALIRMSFYKRREILSYLYNYQGIVYASYGHWGTLIKRTKAKNWILDQHNADIDFWRVYANQTSNKIIKLLAWINFILASLHFPKIYSKVGRIISVCEEDKKLTLSINKKLKIDVIENGVDCSYYSPMRNIVIDRYNILFTGTSAYRNVYALNYFVKNIFPLILKEIPDAKLIIAGNFSKLAQKKFERIKNIYFTGQVDDIRPYFNNSDVYIAPFKETHGSKLKIAEAMAMAIPIVSTPEGIRGFKLENKKNVLIAKNEQEFASFVIGLLRDKSYGKEIGEAARQFVLSYLDWNQLGYRLREIIENTFEELIQR